MVTFFSRHLLYFIDCSQNVHKNFTLLLPWFISMLPQIDRSIIRDRSICMKSTFADRVKWTRSISICSAVFFVLHNDQDRSVRPCNFGSIDPAWSNSLFIIFKNYNLKDIIVILKIISLMRHKVYGISLKGHSYYFCVLKIQFSQKKNPKLKQRYYFWCRIFFICYTVHRNGKDTST